MLQGANSMASIKSKDENAKSVLVKMEIVYHFLWETVITSIISYCFSSALLMIYFQTYPVTVANSVEDILAKPELSVVGYYPAEDLEQNMSEEEFKNLRQRIDAYETKMDIVNQSRDYNNRYLTKYILRDMLEGKSVALMTSYLAASYQDIFSEYKFEIGDNSYQMHYMTYRVPKNHEFSLRITRAYVL